MMGMFGFKTHLATYCFKWREAKLFTVLSQENSFELKKKMTWHNLRKCTYFSFSLIGRAVVKELGHQALQSSQRSLLRCLENDHKGRGKQRTDHSFNHRIASVWPKQMCHIHTPVCTHGGKQQFTNFWIREWILHFIHKQVREGSSSSLEVNVCRSRTDVTAGSTALNVKKHETSHFCLGVFITSASTRTLHFLFLFNRNGTIALGTSWGLTKGRPRWTEVTKWNQTEALVTGGSKFLA